MNFSYIMRSIRKPKDTSPKIDIELSKIAKPLMV